jgi:polysaccharide export outer membrane protein
LDGNVVLPYIGAVKVAGLTLAEAKREIEVVIVDYISDASITVRLVQAYVTLLGEIDSPGMYPISKDRLNIFQAIALAGDVADFGNRYVVSIIRQTPKGSLVKDFDITDKKIIDSEFYYVMPNDVIYIKPMKGKFFGLTNYPWGMLLSTATAAISLFILIQNQILIQQ